MIEEIKEYNARRGHAIGDPPHAPAAETIS